MTDPITILVDGEPVPKQSTRFDGNGRAHTDPRVKAWQDTVSLRAIEAMRGRPPILAQSACGLCLFLEIAGGWTLTT